MSDLFITMESEADSDLRQLKVDYLYLDLCSCTRCIGTDTTLEDALNECAPVLRTLGYRIQLNKVHVATRELAVHYKFVASPTIRVNGIDIFGTVTENDCADCSEIGGGAITCRTFESDGSIFEQPTKAMMVDGLLKVLYGVNRGADKEYSLPPNLEKFYAGRGNAACCGGNGDCC